jgi:high-affinity iron transporter
MAKSLFSITIFFIVFRETLEAAVIISVLLGLADQIIQDDQQRLTTVDSAVGSPSITATSAASDDEPTRRRLVKKLRIQVNLFSNCSSTFCYLFFQILSGAAIGLLIALAVGSA